MDKKTGSIAKIEQLRAEIEERQARIDKVEKDLGAFRKELVDYVDKLIGDHLEGRNRIDVFDKTFFRRITCSVCCGTKCYLYNKAFRFFDVNRRGFLGRYDNIYGEPSYIQYDDPRKDDMEAAIVKDGILISLDDKFVLEDKYHLWHIEPEVILIFAYYHRKYRDADYAIKMLEKALVELSGIADERDKTSFRDIVVAYLYDLQDEPQG